MKKLFILVAMVIISSCTNDDQIITPEVIAPAPPIGSKNELPIDSKLKPAVKHIGNNSTNSRSTEVRKKLVKSVWLASNKLINGAGTNYKYNLNMSMDVYNALPADNLYDPAEIGLNAEKVVYRNYIYSYNLNTQLERIKIESIEEVGANYPDEVYEYNSLGIAERITKDRYYNYTYNAEGLISQKLDGNELKEKYTYDSQKRILKCEFFITAGNELKVVARKDYAYIDDTHFNVYLYQVYASSEELIDIGQYFIDINKPGIYNKEPFYQKDNSYVHTIELRVLDKNGNFKFSSKPKYFYDSEGYLMRVDLHGFNFPGDIRLFYYE